MGGTVNGLAGKVKVGFAGGIGGTVSGLAAKITVGFAGGMGGTVSGLAAKVKVGFAGGMGGTVSGLASAQVATATIAELKRMLRTFNELAIMIFHPSVETKLRIQRVTQKG